MPRTARITSGSGVYHVMLRGINKETIFESRDDYWKFIKLMDRLCHPRDETDRPIDPHCCIYAYCLMPNHVHLLIRDFDGSLANSIKSLSIPYAQYYNVKYERVGHFFQDRFKSEPVNDWEYFVTLLRYIHQNPVAADMVSDVKDYTWSSWREYVNPRGCSIPVCATRPVLDKIPISELEGLVKELLPKAQKILDFNYDGSTRVEDELVRDYIESLCGPDFADVLQSCPRDRVCEMVKLFREFGANDSQISRITGLSYKVLRRMK